MRKLLLIMAVLLLAVSPVFAQTEEPDTQTIADVVTAAASADEPQFTILLMVLQAADPSVLETLSDTESDITVFAPTDEAFEAFQETMGEEVFNAALADSEMLTNILLYHVIEGAVTAEQALDMDGEEVTTLQGSPITIRIEDDTVFINDAEVVEPDMEASNGVIHAINQVLIPPTEVAATAEATEAAATEVVVAESATEEAIATETAVETQEVVATEVVTETEEAIATETAVETQEAVATETVVETQEAVVTEVVTETQEAVATEEAVVVDNTIVGFLQDSMVDAESRFTTLVSLVQNATPEVQEILADPNAQLTFFAPTDEAFAAFRETVGDEGYDALVENQGEMSETLLYHVINGKVLAADIAAGFESEENVDALVAQTLVQGELLLITRDEDGNFYVNGAKLITTDVEVANGVIHVIDAVLSPASEDQ